MASTARSRGQRRSTFPHAAVASCLCRKYLAEQCRRTVWAAEHFPGYLRLSSDTGVAAWQRIEGVISRSILRAKSIQELRSTTEAYMPHFALGGRTLYTSFLNLINPGTTALNLEVVAFDDRGATMGDPVRLALAPGEGRRESVDSFFRFVTPAIFPPFLITGSIRIRELAGRDFQIAGDIEIINRGLEGRDASMLYPISDSAAISWILPFAASFNPYFTGYAIQNPNSLLTVQTDVVVELVGPNGTVLNSTPIQLSPRNRTANVVAASDQAGYLRITSNFPDSCFRLDRDAGQSHPGPDPGLAVIGCRGGRMKGGIPVTGISYFHTTALQFS